jgi:hypothetical protein
MPIEISDPPTPDQWRALVDQAGSIQHAADLIRVHRQSLTKWLRGERTGLWAVADRLRIAIEDLA